MAPKNDVPAYVLGVGLTKFIKPRGQRSYPEMGYEAGVKAMLDAKINYDDVETGVACYCYGDTTSGQRIFYQFGMSSYVYPPSLTPQIKASRSIFDSRTGFLSTILIMHVPLVPLVFILLALSSRTEPSTAH